MSWLKGIAVAATLVSGLSASCVERPDADPQGASPRPRQLTCEYRVPPNAVARVRLPVSGEIRPCGTGTWTFEEKEND